LRFIFERDLTTREEAVVVGGAEGNVFVLVVGWNWNASIACGLGV
jgi:hypothetical protein